MNGGKSTLALQLDYNLSQCGRTGLRFTCMDRSGRAVISSRLGIEADAIQVTPETNILDHVRHAIDEGQEVSYVIADEAQFYTVEQVEQLADIVDTLNVAVSAFGLITDFTSGLFPGSKRLFEIADEHIPLQVQALCWCGQIARTNARVVNGVMATEGAQVLVGDVTDADVRYVLLCRRHFRNGQHQRLHIAA
jgi:thymidine kinase